MCRWATVALLFGVGACEGEQAWTWTIPVDVPAPWVPEDNPMSVAKVTLGRRLFYETDLSGNRTQACSSCHDPARAFTEPRRRSTGSTGDAHPRNAQGLGNVAFAASLTWANPVLRTFEQQARVPLFGEHPVEMGVIGHEDEILGRLRSDLEYEAAFAEVFPGAEPVSFDGVVKALSAFERTFLSFDSPYDRYLQDDKEPTFSDAARRGLALFSSERLKCSRCHGGSKLRPDGAMEVPTFFNTGLYDVDGFGAYPVADPGLFELTGKPEDMGRFRAPSLRNVAVTGPYLHDGSADTLGEVIDIYARGGRLILDGPLAGDGAQNPFKSELITGFRLTTEEKADLLAFLSSLTDETFLKNPDLGPLP